jgi:RNA-directed DNA polymerase
MTASSYAGAVSHAQVNWHAINWRKVHQNVRRLQARIVKATQEGRWGKVKALQRLLTHSFNGRALAVRQVTENQGKKTPGVDQQLWDTPQKKAQAIHQLRRHGNRPLPLKRVYIPKSNGRLRPLGIPCMRDRAQQALYLLALDPIAETTADPNSYGFRKGRSTADALAQCFQIFHLKGSAQWILEGDIRSCFDRISHEWLETNIPMDKVILHQWLKAGFIDKHLLHPTEAGTPQGGPVSPALMNMTLAGLEKLLWAKYRSSAARSQQTKVNVVKYADDFIITGSSKELLESEIKPLVEEFLRERGLELSQEKTKITHIEEGFDFLGQNVRKYQGKLLIMPSANSIKTLLDKVRAVIQAYLPATAGELIVRLNPIIHGWANYHRHVVSKRVYSRVDCAIFKSLWQWATRRHPNKSKTWVARKYFLSTATGPWVFFGQVVRRDGTVQTVQLRKAADVPITRHIKIKGEANPYDPEWELYFEKRFGVKMANNLKGRRKLLFLWHQQNGICPICEQKITELTGWHNHHLVRRTDGGGDEAANLVLLHPTCHNQVHNQGLKVVKSRPARGVRKA